MAISRKIDEVIERGGDVKPVSKTLKSYKFLSQSIRLDVLEKVDKAVSERPGMSRNAWIQEAIQEKLQR